MTATIRTLHTTKYSQANPGVPTGSGTFREYPPFYLYAAICSIRIASFRILIAACLSRSITCPHTGQIYRYGQTESAPYEHDHTDSRSYWTETSGQSLPAVFLPFSLIGQHFTNMPHPLSDVDFPEFQGTSDIRHIKIFDRDQVISISQGCRQLMQEITPLMFGFRMQLCDFQTLCLIPLGAFLLTGKTFLFLCKCRFDFTIWLWKIRVLPLLSTYRFGRDIYPVRS